MWYQYLDGRHLGSPWDSSIYTQTHVWAQLDTNLTRPLLNTIDHMRPDDSVGQRPQWFIDKSSFISLMFQAINVTAK